MPRNLTGKQAKFAMSVAMGKSLAESYREAYEPSNPTAMSVSGGMGQDSLVAESFSGWNGDGVASGQ